MVIWPNGTARNRGLTPIACYLSAAIILMPALVTLRSTPSGAAGSSRTSAQITSVLPKSVKSVSFSSIFGFCIRRVDNYRKTKSSLANAPLPPDAVYFGEISLSGAVRPVVQTAARLKEAQKLGFARAIVPEAARTEGGAEAGQR